MYSDITLEDSQTFIIVLAPYFCDSLIHKY